MLIGALVAGLVLVTVVLLAVLWAVNEAFYRYY